MKKSFFIAIISILSFQIHSQELELDDGIYSEKINNKDTSRHRYTSDNISYTFNKVFIYDYYYLDNSGVKKKFNWNESWDENNPLQLTAYENPGDNGIDKIKIKVDDWLEPFIKYDSTFTQTPFSYFYLNSKGKSKDTLNAIFDVGDESTGVIDNRKNLWIHPPRSYTFRILQLNPYPCYYLDESVQNWSWTLKTGGFYLDQRWIDQQEMIEIKYEYVRARDEELQTPLGKIICKVTSATGSSELSKVLMKTYLKSYYNSKYGFVRLEYTNINGSKIVIQLIEVK